MDLKRRQPIGVELVKRGVVTEEDIQKVLEERRKHLKPFESKYKDGVLKVFSERAVSAMKGGYMK